MAGSTSARPRAPPSPALRICLLLACLGRASLAGAAEPCGASYGAGCLFRFGTGATLSHPGSLAFTADGAGLLTSTGAVHSTADGSEAAGLAAVKAYAGCCAAASPDGTTAAIAGETHTKIFNLQTGALIAEAANPGGLQAHSLAFAPPPADPTAATAPRLAIAGEGGLDIRDPSTGNLVKTLLPTGTGPGGSGGSVALSVESVRFSPDGSLLAVCGEAGARLLRADTGEVAAQLGAAQQGGGGLCDAAFLEDGASEQVMISGPGVALWNVSEGDAAPAYEWSMSAEPRMTAAAISSFWSSASSSSSDPLAAVAWADSLGNTSKVDVFLPSSRADILFSLPHAGVSVSAVAFSPDGSRIATATREGDVFLWLASAPPPATPAPPTPAPGAAPDTPAPPATGAPAADAERPVHRPCGRGFGAQCVYTMDAAPLMYDEVNQIRFAPGGESIAVANEDRSVFVFRTADGAPGWGGPVHLYDTPQEAYRVFFKEGQGGASPSIASFYRSQDGASSGVAIWDGGAASPRHEAASGDAALSPDWTRLATADGKGNVTVSDISDASGGGAAPICRIPIPGASLHDIAFSPDGTRIAYAGWGIDGAQIADAATGAHIASAALGSQASFVRFSPDGASLIVISSQGGGSVRAALFDASTGASVAEVADPEGKPIQSAAFAPDGIHLATGNSYGGVYVWRLGAGGAAPELYFGMQGHMRYVGSLSFSPDSTLLATASGGQIAVWRVEIASFAPPTIAPTAAPTAAPPTASPPTPAPATPQPDSHSPSGSPPGATSAPSGGVVVPTPDATPSPGGNSSAGPDVVEPEKTDSPSRDGGVGVVLPVWGWVMVALGSVVVAALAAVGVRALMCPKRSLYDSFPDECVALQSEGSAESLEEMAASGGGGGGGSVSPAGNPTSSPRPAGDTLFMDDDPLAV